MSELELFFDLVFVYALTRVTDLLADTTTLNLLHSLLVLAVMWWVWVGYAWLGNVVRADRGAAKLAMFVAMAASFVLALSIPEAFNDKPGRVLGPVVFAVGYSLVRAVHLVTFWLLAEGDAQLRGQLARWAPKVAAASGIFVVAAFTHGVLQTWLWVAALAIDYIGTMVAGNDWRLRSASHFAERHGLIILIALGESIVEIGTGIANVPISWPILGTALLGLSLCSLLWWVYFDMAAPAVQQALRNAQGEEQIRIARACYTFLHLPMVVGIVGLSLGLEKIMAIVAEEHHHQLRDALHGIPLYLMFGGVALFLGALVAFKYFALRTVTVTRVVAMVVVLASIPFAAAMPGLAALALLTAILAITVVYETVHFPELRAQVRAE